MRVLFVCCCSRASGGGSSRYERPARVADIYVGQVLKRVTAMKRARTHTRHVRALWHDAAHPCELCAVRAAPQRRHHHVLVRPAGQGRAMQARARSIQVHVCMHAWRMSEQACASPLMCVFEGPRLHSWPHSRPCARVCVKGRGGREGWREGGPACGSRWQVGRVGDERRALAVQAQRGRAGVEAAVVHLRHDMQRGQAARTHACMHASGSSKK